MSEQVYNHRVKRSELEIAMITGGEITAHCGETFEPGLRVGSSGQADDPDLEMCPRCDQIRDIRERQWELSDECEALNERARELRSKWAAERAEMTTCG